MSFVTAEAVEKRIRRIRTQYRESPLLIGMLSGYLTQIAEMGALTTSMLDMFPIDDAVGDQLSIIGKWLGWPRLHCQGRRTLAFGYGGDLPPLVPAHGNFLTNVFDYSSAFPEALLFDRESVGSRVDALKRIDLEPADTPRLDHNPATGAPLGIIIEPEHNGKLTQSEYPEVAAAYVTANAFFVPYAAKAPDGTMTARKLVETVTAATAHFFQPLAQIAVAAGEVAKYALYLKASERTRAMIRLDNSSTCLTGANHNASINLATGAVSNILGAGVTYSVEPADDGWWRLLLKVTATADGLLRPLLLTEVTAGSYVTTGDGKSGLYVWGLMDGDGSYVPSVETFQSRNGKANTIGPDGSEQVVNNDVLRMDYNPLDLTAPAKKLLEPAAVNLIVYPENFVHPAGWWANANVLFWPHADTGADSKRSMTRINITSGSGYVAQSMTVPAGETLPYAWSVDFKPGTAAYSQLSLSWFTGGSSVGAQIVIDWATKLVTVSGTAGNMSGYVKRRKNGVYRLTLVAQNNGGANTVIQAIIYGAATLTGTVYIGKAQLEKNTHATSFVVPNTAFTSRADVGTPATTIGPDGKIQTVAAGAVRYLYNRADLTAPPVLLLEAAATNSFKSSGDLRGAFEGNAVTAWNNAGVAGQVASMSDVPAPKAGQFYTLITCDGSVGNDRRQNIAIAAGTSWVLDCYAKRGTLPNMNMQIHFVGGVTATCAINYNWATKVLSSSGVALKNFGVIEIGPDEIYIWVAGTDDGDGTQAYALVNSTGVGSIGTGTIYLWGVNFKSGLIPSSYIETTTVAVTRAADIATSTASTRAADIWTSAAGVRKADVLTLQAQGNNDWAVTLDNGAVLNFNDVTGNLVLDASDIPVGRRIRSYSALSNRESCGDCRVSYPVAGYCEGARYISGDFMYDDYTFTDDELYRRYLIARASTVLAMNTGDWNRSDLELVASMLFDQDVIIVREQKASITLCLTRFFTTEELALLHLTLDVLPIPPGVELVWAHCDGSPYGYGDGWGELCDSQYYSIIRDPLKRTPKSELFGYGPDYSGYCEGIYGPGGPEQENQ